MKCRVSLLLEQKLFRSATKHSSSLTLVSNPAKKRTKHYPRMGLRVLTKFHSTEGGPKLSTNDSSRDSDYTARIGE